jgi:thiol-disulfide isomerase/thioredoxin
MDVLVYTRDDCHLCAEALAVIERVADETGVEVDVETVNVDSDPDLRATYGDRVPYVFVDGEPKFKYRVDPAELRALMEG